jgi:hypothetical protein
MQADRNAMTRGDETERPGKRRTRAAEHADGILGKPCWPRDPAGRNSLGPFGHDNRIRRKCYLRHRIGAAFSQRCLADGRG